MKSKRIEEDRTREIVDACERLYAATGFHAVSLRDIARETSMSRPSVYNYFRTKEEIFLALFAREYDRWNASLSRLLARPGALDAAAFAAALARTLRGRGLLLRLLSMNLYDMEAGSRLENLTAFKRSYGESIRLVQALLAKFRPGMPPAARESFVWAFFPFLFGVHPYTAATPKQRAAMAAAGIDFPTIGVEALVRSFVRTALLPPVIPFPRRVPQNPVKKGPHR